MTNAEQSGTPIKRGTLQKSELKIPLGKTTTSTPSNSFITKKPEQITGIYSSNEPTNKELSTSLTSLDESSKEEQED